MTAPKAHVEFLRETYIPLIHDSLKVPKGEMRWLVNKCGTLYYRLKREGLQPIPASLKVSNEPFCYSQDEGEWRQGRFENALTGNVYYIKFRVENEA